jgi:hypothetical protein
MQWIQIASKGIGAFTEGSVQSGNAANDARAEDENAKNLMTLASQIGQKGAADEDQARREYRSFAGDQLASISESNLGTDGSALDVARDSESKAYLDALNIRHEAGEQARVVRYGAEQAHMRSKLAREFQKRAKYKMFLEGTGILGSTDKFAGLRGR